jgi:hypothetical protein
MKGIQKEDENSDNKKDGGVYHKTTGLFQLVPFSRK